MGALVRAIRRDPTTAAVWLAIGLLHAILPLALHGALRTAAVVAGIAFAILYVDLIGQVRRTARRRRGVSP